MSEAVTEMPAAKQRFKLLHGIHYESNPEWAGKNLHDPARHTKFLQGATVESTEDLDIKFVNKFERLIPGLNTPIEVTDERRKAVSELLASPGSCWEESERKNLEEMPENVFAKLHVLAIAKFSGKKIVSPLGDDVTDSFQRAYDEGFKVFRNAVGKHQVCRSNAPGVPINKEPLEATKVDKFVETFLKEK